MKKILITEDEKHEILVKHGLIREAAETPICNSSGCKGTYEGPQFDVNCRDIAHQYSNIITRAVASKLKELYDSGEYSKVNLDEIVMTTTSVGGNCTQNPTTYTINIPFVQVRDKCDARTGFGHVGGWGHEGAGIDKRKDEIYNDTIQDPNDPKKRVRSNPVVGTMNDMEYVRKSTPQGLVEYWIQWKHSSRQSDCVNQTKNTANLSTVGNSTWKIEPQKITKMGIVVVKENGKILVPNKVKADQTIGGVWEPDYDYILLLPDGSTYACQTKDSTPSCYSSNRKNGNVVNKTEEISTAKLNLGL